MGVAKCRKGIMVRSTLKNAFSPDIGVEASYQILSILEYACGFLLGVASISIENPNLRSLLCTFAS